MHAKQSLDIAPYRAGRETCFRGERAKALKGHFVGILGVHRLALDEGNGAPAILAC